eukprot:Nk52_evm7s376 gene=Nk52_evmTU7s376
MKSAPFGASIRGLESGFQGRKMRLVVLWVVVIVVFVYCSLLNTALTDTLFSVQNQGGVSGVDLGDKNNNIKGGFPQGQESESQSEAMRPTSLPVVDRSKRCLSTMFKKELLKCPVDRKIISEDTKEKYLTFLFTGGLNNCLVAIEYALTLAADLNRTLVIPYVTSDHVKRGAGATGSSYAELKHNVVRKDANGTLLDSMRFRKVRFRSFKTDSRRDMQLMEVMSFSTYFKMKQLQGDVQYRIEDGITDYDVVNSDKKKVKVVFMEDNPEFWASKTFYCPMWDKFAVKGIFYEHQEFKYGQEDDQFMCTGYAFRLSRTIPGGFNPHLNLFRSIGFSDPIKSLTKKVLGFGGMELEQYMGIHIRRGDFSGYCKWKAKSNLEGCYPSYGQIIRRVGKLVAQRNVTEKLAVNEANHVPKPKDILSNLDAGKDAEVIELKDDFPIYVATNEKNPKVLDALVSSYGWNTLESLTTPSSSKECKGKITYPFLEATLDANILYESGVLMWNTYSTLSRRVNELRIMQPERNFINEAF